MTITLTREVEGGTISVSGENPEEVSATLSRLVKEWKPEAAASPDVPDPVLDQSIGVLDASVRLYTILERRRCRTLRDVVRLTQYDLYKLKGFGKTSFGELQRKLANLGLGVGMLATGSPEGGGK